MNVTYVIIAAVAITTLLITQTASAKHHNPLAKVGQKLEMMFNTDTDNCHQHKKSEKQLCQENALLRQQLQGQVMTNNNANPLSAVGDKLNSMFKSGQ